MGKERLLLKMALFYKDTYPIPVSLAALYYFRRLEFLSDYCHRKLILLAVIFILRKMTINKFL